MRTRLNETVVPASRPTDGMHPGILILQDVSPMAGILREKPLR
jgi:hypothetical protein